jgi:hypothetical protein
MHDDPQSRRSTMCLLRLTARNKKQIARNSSVLIKVRTGFGVDARRLRFIFLSSFEVNGVIKVGC